MNHVLFRRLPLLLLALMIGWGGAQKASAQADEIGVYVPLIGITSVPTPLALPDGAGSVTYKYAVKNFLAEHPLTDVAVVDDTCRPVTYVEGDDNQDGLLDASETWRFTCTTILATTTQSIATATGVANNITATHRAYATVVVGAETPAPLVSIVNITKVAYPLSLPEEGGQITFTYRVNNPGDVPLSDVTVTDVKCSSMSNKLGDTNGNGLLDVHEVWIYTCKATLKETTTNTVYVTAFANGLKAVDYATITVKVALASKTPTLFPNTGLFFDFRIAVWAILAGTLAVLVVVFFIVRTSRIRRRTSRKKL